MNHHYIVSENVRFDVVNNNKGESLKNARIGNLAILTSDVLPARANVYIPENDRSELINGETRCGRESQPKGRYSNIEEGLESSVSNEAKDRINRIVGDVKSLSDVEKLLLYLRLPTGDTSKDLRQTPTSCLQTSNRTEQAQAYTWIRSHLEEDVEICLPKQEVYDDYRVYCENHGIRPLSTADFGKLMKCVFPNVKPRRLGQRGQSRYCYGGLRKKLDIEAPGLPDLEISPHKQQDAGSEDDELYAASCQLVCEWAQKLLEQNFPSVRELAEHLVSHLYVNSKSVSAFTVVAGMQETGIQNMKVSSMFSNTTGGDRHRETQLQLQRKLHEREQLREHKKKLQMQKEENEQKAKEAQDRMTPSLASPTLLRALTSPARRIFDRKDEDSNLLRSKSVLSGNTGKSKQNVIDSLRSKSSLGKDKVTQKEEKSCQDMDVDGSRSPGKGQGQTNDELRAEAMDTDNETLVHLSSTNQLNAKEHTDEKKTFTKLKSSPDNSRKQCEIGREEWNLLIGRVHSAQQMRDTLNLGDDSPSRAFHTIMKPAVLSQHRPHKSESDLQRVTVTGMTEESREISLSPDVVEEKIIEQSPKDVSHEIVPNFDAMETVENLGKSDECLYLSMSSVSTSVSPSVSSSSVSSRSAFVPFSQMSTRKENDILSMRIPSSTLSQISSVVSQTDVHPKTSVSVSSSESIQSKILSNIPQCPSIPSHESQNFASVEATVKPPGSLSLNLNSPGSINVSYPTCTTVGLLGAMSTTSDIPTSQALPQTSPSTPKKTKSRFTPIRPKASPSKTVSNILKEKSTENSIYNKSKPVATLLKEKRAREAEVLAQSQMNGGVAVSPGGINQASSGVQIQNIQNITASTLPKSLELNKPGEFFIILNPVSKMSVVSPVATVTQSLLSNSATMTTSSRGKPEMSRGHRSANPSRSRTNSSSESEIESIFPTGKESWGMASDSAEESFTDFNMDETPSKLVKIDCDQGVSSRPGSRCSVDRETPSFGRKRKFYTCGNNSYHKRINSTDDTDDEVVIIEQKENDKDSRRAKSCSLDQQDKDEIMSPVHKENLNNTIDSIHCPDISILEIDALSDSGLDSEQLQLFTDSNTPKSLPQTQTAAVGVNSLLLRHSQRELLKQKEVLDERMRSYWNKESKVNKSDVVNIKVHSELPQDVADFITDALTGIANTNINENEDTNKTGNGDMEMQHSRLQSLGREKKGNGSGGTVTSRNFLQPIATSPLTTVSMKTQRKKDSVQDNGQEKGQNQEISAKTLTLTNFVSPQRPVRRQRTPSIERLLGPTVTPDRHVQLQSPLDRGLTCHNDKVSQYMSEQGKATTPTSFASPVHPVMQRKREMSVDRISNQTPFSDAGYGSIGASPIQTSTPVSGLGGICDTTLNSTSSAGLLMSRPDSVQSLASDSVMQSPVPSFSPRNYTSTPLTVRSPCSTQNSNPLQSPLGMGPPTRAFMPIQSSSTQKLETTVTLIKPTVTMASGNGGEGKEILKDLIGIGSIQPEVQRQTRPPPSYRAAVQSLTYLQAENTENSGAFNRPPSGPIDFPMTDLVSPTKHQSVMGMMGKNNETLPDLNLQLNPGNDPGQPDKSIANAYPCSFQLALMSQKSREDGKEAASGTKLYRSGLKGTKSASSGNVMINTATSRSPNCQETGQYTDPKVLGKSPLHMLEGYRNDRFPENMVLGQSPLQQPDRQTVGHYMEAMGSGRSVPPQPTPDGHKISQFEGGCVQEDSSNISKRPNSQQSDHSTRDIFNPEIQGRELMSGGMMVRNSKERDIESILNILKEPTQHSKQAEKGKQGGSVKKVHTVLPNANYKGNAPNVNLTNTRISEKLRPYVMDKVMTSVMDDVEFSARRNLMPDLMEEPSSTEINEEELISTLEDLRSVDEKYFVQDDFNSKRL